MTATDAHRAAAEFNTKHPEGTPVLAYPFTRDDKPLTTSTRSPAWVMPSGDAVVMVKGHAGGIALTHIDVDKARNICVCTGGWPDEDLTDGYCGACGLTIPDEAY